MPIENHHNNILLQAITGFHYACSCPVPLFAIKSFLSSSLSVYIVHENCVNSVLEVFDNNDNSVGNVHLPKRSTSSSSASLGTFLFKVAPSTTLQYCSTLEINLMDFLLFLPSPNSSTRQNLVSKARDDSLTFLLTTVLDTVSFSLKRLSLNFLFDNKDHWSFVGDDNNNNYLSETDVPRADGMMLRQILFKSSKQQKQQQRQRRLPHLESLKLSGLCGASTITLEETNSKQQNQEDRSLIRSLGLRELSIEFGGGDVPTSSARFGACNKISSLALPRFIREVTDDGRTLEKLKLSTSRTTGRTLACFDEPDLTMDDFMGFILHGQGENAGLPRLEVLDLSSFCIGTNSSSALARGAGVPGTSQQQSLLDVYSRHTISQKTLDDYLEECKRLEVLRLDPTLNDSHKSSLVLSSLPSCAQEEAEGKYSETEIVHRREPNLFFLRDDQVPLGGATCLRELSGIAFADSNSIKNLTKIVSLSSKNLLSKLDISSFYLLRSDIVVLGTGLPNLEEFTWRKFLQTGGDNDDDLSRRAYFDELRKWLWEKSKKFTTSEDRASATQDLNFGIDHVKNNQSWFPRLRRLTLMPRGEGESDANDFLTSSSSAFSEQRKIFHQTTLNPFRHGHLKELRTLHLRNFRFERTNRNRLSDDRFVGENKIDISNINNNNTTSLLSTLLLENIEITVKDLDFFFLDLFTMGKNLKNIYLGFEFSSDEDDELLLEIHNSGGLENTDNNIDDNTRSLITSMTSSYSNLFLDDDEEHLGVRNLEMIEIYSHQRRGQDHHQRSLELSTDEEEECEALVKKFQVFKPSLKKLSFAKLNSVDSIFNVERSTSDDCSILKKRQNTTSIVERILGLH